MRSGEERKFFAPITPPQIPNFLETFNSHSIEFSSLVDATHSDTPIFLLFSEFFILQSSVIESFSVR